MHFATETEQLLHEANDRLAVIKAELERVIAQNGEQTQRLEAQKAELEMANALLEAQATRDGLTGLTNHRSFYERLREEVERANRYDGALAVVLLDVDDFKVYNDTFGHPAGDRVLRRVAEVLKAAARTTDIVARYGGEEFAVILAEADVTSARRTADRFRTAISAVPWEDRQITASVGVAALSLKIRDAAALVDRADAALYRSKRRGRNCVTCDADPLQLSEIGDELPDVEVTGYQQAMDLSQSVGETVRFGNGRRGSRAYDSIVLTWSRILNLQEKETEGHCRRVTGMAVRLARAWGLDEEQVVFTRWGAQLHDIGKVGVPDSILKKPGPLTDGEWEIVRRHPVIAHEMLAPIPFLGPALDIPFYHHERWDGAGYPRGLKGEEIPLCTRLFAVVDVYDSLRSERADRLPWSEARVRKYLQDSAGTQFDPRAVRAFLKLLDAVRVPVKAAGR